MLNSFSCGSMSSLASRCGMSRASVMDWMCEPKRGSKGPNIACTPKVICLQAVGRGRKGFVRAERMYDGVKGECEDVCWGEGLYEGVKACVGVKGCVRR